MSKAVKEMKNEGVENMKEQMQEPENILEMVPEQQTVTVKDLLKMNIARLGGINFNMSLEDLARFKVLIDVMSATRNDMIACVEAIEKEEQKNNAEDHAE